jgi:uncharacterized RDD family membrane protein YckC
MARWRDTKAGKQTLKSKKSSSATTQKNLEVSAPLLDRFKAMITDSFMLIMPIMYIIIYLVMGSGEQFSQNMALGWILILLPYGIVTSLFLIFKGQTPGLKAYELKVVKTQTHENLGIFQSVFRYLIFIVCIASIWLMFVPLFRKDKKTLQDLLTKTTVISYPNK